jgi:hypothetical protein
MAAGVGGQGRSPRHSLCGPGPARSTSRYACISGHSFGGQIST